ncbi:hypothetical protein [Mesorhizobium sp.]|uniref:hypothetical protein n=1 Tax=Mesorhizobium sp. TaxID=1871066 RepID=UPI0025FD9288|nr:hypothetical protein [Mesorhizobium sp.]
MTKLEQIEKSVAELSPEELKAFAAWFETLQADLWNKQIEADAKAGRLDKLVAEARAEIAAGKLRDQRPFAIPADKNFTSMRPIRDIHPSISKGGRALVGQDRRHLSALALESADASTGSGSAAHAEYDRLIK